MVNPNFGKKFWDVVTAGKELLYAVSEKVVNNVVFQNLEDEEWKSGIYPNNSAPNSYTEATGTI